MTPNAGKIVGGCLAAIIFGSFALEIWGDFTRDARLQKQREAQNLQREKWLREHPAEAAAGAAQMKRSEARMYRLFRAIEVCRERASSTEIMDRCFKDADRREALECLRGPDWETCEAINR